MDRAETLGIMRVLKAAYPNFYKGIGRDDLEGIVDLWQTMFSDDKTEVVAMAVKALINSDTKGFPPVIGQVKEYIRKISAKEEMTELQAWVLVKKALGNSNYGSEKEFAKLPLDIQSVLCDPQTLREWAVLDAKEVDTVIQSNFMRSYKARAKANKEYLSLPADVRERMSQIMGGSTLDFMAIE